GTGTNAAPLAPTVPAPKAAPAPTAGAAITVATAPPPTKLPPPPPPLSVVKPTTIAAVLEERKKAAAVTDAIGSEQISKGTASDAGDIVSKVTGTSIVEGKFVVVRGLADRYTSTTLNGADIPSADPYRKSVQLDLFPSAIIDSIVVSKTFTPNLAGAFTGGAVDIVTKSIPARRFFKLSLGASYNTQASMSDAFPSYSGGALDWTAIEDGTRALPDSFSDPNLVIPGRVGTSATSAANANLVRLTRDLGPAQFGPVNGSSPLNNSFSLSLGDQFYLLGKPAGYFIGLNYNRNFTSYEDAVRDRFRNSVGTLEKALETKDTRGVMEASWVTSVSLGLKPAEGHEFGFSFLYNQFAEDTARRSVGDVIATDGTRRGVELTQLNFVERHLHTFQLKGGHELPRHNAPRFDWQATLSETTQEEPDSRFFNAFTREGPAGTVYSINNNEIPQPILPTRFFRNLEDVNLNLKADFKWPFALWNGEDAEFKSGGYFSASKREFRERTFQYRMISATGVASETGNFIGTPNTFLDETALLFTSGRLERYLVNDLGNSRYTGRQDVTAAYSMLDLPVTENLRLIGGARLEMTDLSLEGTGGSGLGTAAGLVQGANWLPSLNLVFNLAKDMNVRLAWAQTIARPSYREIANYQAYDPAIDTLVRGNPNLKLSSIDNYDLRWEWFPRPGEVFSVSGFYKKIQNPIERRLVDLQGDILEYENRDQATVYGVEFEARKKLDFISPHLDNFSWGFSYSILNSEVKLTPTELAQKRLGVPNAKGTRQLFEQSPFIINADLNYDNRRTGTSMSLSYNVVGERLTIASALTDDVYEQPAPSLDFVWSQRLRPGMSLKFTARNLLDPVFRRTYGAKDDPAAAYSAFTRGMTFGISLAYEY
ncbi:MAG: hypothetical protein FJ382_14965, partial [Verrucomicrobia bacterium]|nr:hypothetical protein [Verrucomicrobiota bacterium]